VLLARVVLRRNVVTARAIGSGTVSFGLVSIPVKLYSTNEARAGVSFNLLHGECGTRLKQQYVCPKCEKVVDRDQMVKGYEFAKGQYVTFTPEELEALEAQATESIDITEFVPDATVSPLYYDKGYYLGPDKGGAKAYSLLAEAMRRTGRVALAKYAARGKQYLVMVRPQGRGLVMQQLRYADEVKPMSEVPLDEQDVSDRELDLAMKLIDQIASDEFKPDQYEDEVRAKTMHLIEQKVQGQDIVAQPEEQPQAKVIDLMEALKASLVASGAAAGKAGGGGQVELEKKAAHKPEKAARADKADKADKADEAPAEKAGKSRRRAAK
jgi:DNA end-binding protein Ku